MEKNRNIQTFSIFFRTPMGKIMCSFYLRIKTHSGWKQLFCEKWGTSNRERILNLVFKFYILSQGLPVETMNGFEELLLTPFQKSKQIKRCSFGVGAEFVS